eukprot:gene11027-12857_t
MGKPSRKQAAARAKKSCYGLFASAISESTKVTEEHREQHNLNLQDIVDSLLELLQVEPDVDDDELDIGIQYADWENQWADVIQWNNQAMTTNIVRGYSVRSEQRRKRNLHLLAESVRDQAGAMHRYYPPAVLILNDFGVEAFMPAELGDRNPPEIVETIQRMQEAVQELETREANIHNNARLEKKTKDLSHFAYLQYVSVLRYFQRRLQGHKQVVASVYVAQGIWNKSSPDSYKSRAIVRWSQQFLLNGKISESK